MEDFFKFIDYLHDLAHETKAGCTSYRFAYRGGVVEIRFRLPRTK